MKTRKPDAAERIAVAWYPIDSYTTGEEDEYAREMRTRLASKIRRALRAEAKRAACVVWRPMSEPPEPDTPVLLCYGNGEVMDQTAWISASGHWFTRNSQIHYVADGHWTELPPPPKARKGASQ